MIYSLILLSSSTCSGIDSDHLYSFGRDIGDEEISFSDSGSTHPLPLSTPFVLFGQNKSTVYVSKPIVSVIMQSSSS